MVPGLSTTRGMSETYQSLHYFWESSSVNFPIIPQPYHSNYKISEYALIKSAPEIQRHKLVLSLKSLPNYWGCSNHQCHWHCAFGKWISFFNLIIRAQYMPFFVVYSCPCYYKAIVHKLHASGLKLILFMLHSWWKNPPNCRWQISIITP